MTEKHLGWCRYNAGMQPDLQTVWMNVSGLGIWGVIRAPRLGFRVWGVGREPKARLLRRAGRLGDKTRKEDEGGGCMGANTPRDDLKVCSEREMALSVWGRALCKSVKANQIPHAGRLNRELRFRNMHNDTGTKAGAGNPKQELHKSPRILQNGQEIGPKMCFFPPASARGPAYDVGKWGTPQNFRFRLWRVGHPTWKMGWGTPPILQKTWGTPHYVGSPAQNHTHRGI
ncbi:hypothetical protein K438DRAFT_1760068 [Mycena galopus ATCC 62051]|nr:hypothetical protein K438DRAFT_1760068 [Mycena galopus ATCC 62051]